MVHREKLDKMSEDELRDSLVEDTISYGEEYYNQTYNQKIPELLYKDGTPMRKVKLCKEAQELLDEATKRFNQNK
jgi:hypothetical protein